MSYRPWTTRSIGVEMEMNDHTTTRGDLDCTRIARALEDAALTFPVGHNVGQYYHSNGRTWDVKRDGSCGYEVASPALMLDAEGHNSDLKNACAAINSLNPNVDRRCGLHVHVDCSDYTWNDLQRLMALWVRYEPFFFELMPVPRRRNQYCRPTVRNTWNDSMETNSHCLNAVLATTESRFRSQSQGMDRYNCLNVAGWWRHQRIEFRLHSGTTNYTKIRHWAMLVTALVQRVKERGMPAISTRMDTGPARALPTSYICKQLGLLPSSIRNDVPEESVRLSAWLNARRLQFTPSLATVFQTEAGQVRNVPVRRSNVVRQLDPMRARDSNRCAAFGVNCQHPRAPGIVLCAEHNTDWAANEAFRILTPPTLTPA